MWRRSNALGILPLFSLIPGQINRGGGCGKGLDTEEHAASLKKEHRGAHGKSYLLSDPDGQIRRLFHLRGLDYPGVGPEHSYLKDRGRVEYRAITDWEALEAFTSLTRTEGIIPALESAHAVAEGMKLGRQLEQDEIMVINLSGRGDKDIPTVAQLMEVNL